RRLELCGLSPVALAISTVFAMPQAALQQDPFSARRSFDTGNGPAALYDLARLETLGLAKIAELPYSIRLLLEAALRTCDGYEVTEQDVKNLASWRAGAVPEVEIPFK